MADLDRNLILAGSKELKKTSKRSKRKPPGGGDEPEIVYLKMSPEFAEGIFARKLLTDDERSLRAHFTYLRAVLEHHAGVPAHEAMVAYDRAKGISDGWATDRWCAQELPEEPGDSSPKAKI